MKEDVTLSFGEGEPSRWLVDQHLLDQVEEVLPRFWIRTRLWHITAQGFAVLANVSSGRGLLVPNESAFFEVLDSRFRGHSGWKPTENALHHGQVFAIVVSLEEGEPEGQFE